MCRRLGSAFANLASKQARLFDEAGSQLRLGILIKFAGNDWRRASFQIRTVRLAAVHRAICSSPPTDRWPVPNWHIVNA